MLERAQGLNETLIALRCEVHQHPELSFNERRTAQLVAERLHHHPQFDIDERCLPLGAALLAEIAMRYLKQASSQ